LIPHGEAYTINEYLTDKETGYSPSQYYVYDYNTYAKLFVMNLPKGTTLETTNPKMEVIHPMKHPDLRGVDKVGAFMIMKNNRYRRKMVYKKNFLKRMVVWKHHG